MSDGIIRNDFDLDVAREVEAARSQFPRPDGLLAALTEEVGEVARALLDKPWSEVYAEAVQVAAMAQRLAEEGDPTLTDIRQRRGLDMPDRKPIPNPFSGYGGPVEFSNLGSAEPTP